VRTMSAGDRYVVMSDGTRLDMDRPQGGPGPNGHCWRCHWGPVSVSRQRQEEWRPRGTPGTVDDDAALLVAPQPTAVMQDLTGHKRIEISQTLPLGGSVCPACMMVGPLDDGRARDGKSKQAVWRIVALDCAPMVGGQLPGHCCGMLHMRSVALHLAFVIVSDRMDAGRGCT
jgi:hypothetical protein